MLVGAQNMVIIQVLGQADLRKQCRPRLDIAELGV